MPANVRAYVIGNVAVDETISVSTMPEAGASILGREETRDLGGKGANQAVVMARTGLPTTLVAAVGEDFRAQTIRNQLAPEPVEAKLIALAGRSSDFSIIFTTPDGENAIVTTTDSAGSLTTEEAIAGLDTAVSGNLMALQGNLSQATTLGLLQEARRRDLITAFNPSPLRPYFGDFWPLVDIAFLNRGEAESLFIRHGSDRKAAAIGRAPRRSDAWRRRRPAGKPWGRYRHHSGRLHQGDRHNRRRRHLHGGGTGFGCVARRRARPPRHRPCRIRLRPDSQPSRHALGLPDQRGTAGDPGALRPRQGPSVPQRFSLNQPRIFFHRRP